MNELLLHLPPDTGMAFIYIQHLDRDYDSNLAEILARNTAMTVVTVENQMELKPNHVYVTPPDKEVGVTNNPIVSASTAQHQ